MVNIGIELFMNHGFYSELLDYQKTMVHKKFDTYIYHYLPIAIKCWFDIAMEAMVHLFRISFT
jgi:hypothetical protein